MPNTPEGRSDAPATRAFLVILAWIAVGIPMLWGIWMTLQKAALLFR